MANTLTVTYDGRNIISGFSIDAGAAVTYDGQTIVTVAANQTKTLNCAGKYAKSNIGIAGKTLSCAGKILKTDIVVTVEPPHDPNDYIELTSGTTWTVPDNMRGVEARFGIFSGFQAGYNGSNGSAGQGDVYDDFMGTVTHSQGNPGGGGPGGAGGTQCYYYLSPIIILGDSYTMRIGAGGSSGGQMGNHTTIGGYSSANGSLKSSQVANLIKASVKYNIPGDTGTAGGTGGAGGYADYDYSQADNGASGGSVRFMGTTYSGGGGGAGATGFLSAAGGGGGGGAAVGASGGAGSSGTAEFLSSRGGNGGAGASAKYVSVKSTKGVCGTGGPGGGGGGAGGFTSDSSYGGSSGGSAGAGGDGHYGADGLIVVYWYNKNK